MGFEATRAEPSDLRDHSVYQFRHTSTGLAILAIPKAGDVGPHNALPPRTDTMRWQCSYQIIKRAQHVSRERTRFFGYVVLKGSDTIGSLKEGRTTTVQARHSNWKWKNNVRHRHARTIWSPGCAWCGRRRGLTRHHDWSKGGWGHPPRPIVLCGRCHSIADSGSVMRIWCWRLKLLAWRLVGRLTHTSK